MTAFDDLTLGEVEMMTTEALGGKSISEADPLMLSGAVMWITELKANPTLPWDEFKARVKMSEIKTFSETNMSENGDDEANPPLALPEQQS